MLEEKKKKVKTKKTVLWITYFAVLVLLFIIIGILENYSESLSNLFLVIMLIYMFVGIIFTGIVSSKLTNSVSLSMTSRDMPLLYKDIRAICSIDVLLDTLNVALADNIIFYMLKFAYEDKIYFVGYENNQNITYYLLCDDIEQKFDSNDKLKSALKMEHDVTVLDEYQSSNFLNASSILGFEADVMRMNLKDNFMLNKYIVSDKAENYNYNIGANIQKQISNNVSNKKD